MGVCVWRDGCGRMLMSDDYQVSKMDLLTDDGLKKNTLQTRQEGRGEVFLVKKSAAPQ